MQQMTDGSKTTDAGPAKRRMFMFYSRPLFRTCEIVCNHVARVLFSKRSLADAQVRSRLNELNQARIEFQRTLNEIGGSHIHVCAECKGKCCGGAKERDAFTDRVLQDPDTDHLAARRKCGEMAAHKIMAGRSEGRVDVMEAPSVEGFCPELTVEGCRIPYELRPIQCTAYFCRPTADELSSEECRRGIEALAGLMRTQIQTAMLAMKSRFGAN